MRLDTKKALIDKYTFFYRIYFVLSMILVVVAIVLTAIYYLTRLRDVITISHLFILLFIFLMGFYFRMNAFHYYRLKIEIQLPVRQKEKARMSTKKRPIDKN